MVQKASAAGIEPSRGPSARETKKEKDGLTHLESSSASCGQEIRTKTSTSG